VRELLKVERKGLGRAGVPPQTYIGDEGPFLIDIEWRMGRELEKGNWYGGHHRAFTFGLAAMQNQGGAKKV